MAGVGIRAAEFARALAPHADVTLAAVPGSSSPVDGVPLVEYRHQDPRDLKPLIATADVVVCQPSWPILMTWLSRSGARIILDLYVPEVFEVLEGFRDRTPPVRGLLGPLITDRLVSGLHVGHHFLCASEKQKDLWVGAMVAERLIRFGAYEHDPSFESVIAPVPFGVSADAPVATPGYSVRSKFPQIGADDDIVLWNGGLWGWLDAPTAVRAMPALLRRRPNARLVFMGAANHRPALRATHETRACAEELGLLDSHVFFNDEWVPYEHRAGWLLEADCAVSCHVEHLETRYAFRTRLLDCFWAGLPIVCTRGDDLAARVEADHLGAAVGPGDADAVAAALADVLDAGKVTYAEGLAQAAADHEWPVVTRPLVEFVTSDEPPVALGDGFLARTSIRPGQRARSIAYRSVRQGLNAVGLRDWPKQGLD